jgi:hypothetical protein
MRIVRKDEIRGNFRFFVRAPKATLGMLIKVIKTHELFSSDLAFS